jgi:hypothetical protein
MEPSVSQAMLLIRQDWRDAPEGYGVLFEQLKMFPQGYVDGPDALHGAWKQTRSRYYMSEEEISQEVSNGVA